MGAAVRLPGLPASNTPLQCVHLLGSLPGEFEGQADGLLVLLLLLITTPACAGLASLQWLSPLSSHHFAIQVLVRPTPPSPLKHPLLLHARSTALLQSVSQPIHCRHVVLVLCTRFRLPQQQESTEKNSKTVVGWRVSLRISRLEGVQRTPRALVLETDRTPRAPSLIPQP